MRVVTSAAHRGAGRDEEDPREAEREPCLRVGHARGAEVAHPAQDYDDKTRMAAAPPPRQTCAGHTHTHIPKKNMLPPSSEREARVEQLHKKAAMRITNQGIMRGWTAWQEQYLQAARHKRMLAAASSRLARPALAASVGHWRSDWEGARRKEIAEAVRRKERERFEGKGFKSAKKGRKGL